MNDMSVQWFADPDRELHFNTTILIPVQIDAWWPRVDDEVGRL